MPDDAAAADHQDGDAAQAIRSAELALAHQNSATAQVDLQVVAAVLNAHQKAAASRDALNLLQRDIENAVATRSDLDTPAGARDFQRFLIGKLRDIQAVVTGATLDDTSNSALLAAWTALYNSAQTADSGQPARASASPAAHSGSAASDPDDDLFGDDDVDDSGEVPVQSAPAAAPAAPPFSGLPAFGGSGTPGGAGFGLPEGLTLPTALPGGLTQSDPDDEEGDDAEARLASDDTDHDADTDQPAPGPTPVTLPNGDTLTAPSPQIAAAIEAAASGTPIPDAYRAQGMTIPSPGTPVPESLDPQRLTPGDIGLFVDRHALALGDRRALVSGQIQDISTVSGPSFLGWVHPPEPAPTQAPDAGDQPTQTRPAVAEETETA